MVLRVNLCLVDLMGLLALLALAALAALIDISFNLIVWLVFQGMPWHSSVVTEGSKEASIQRWHLRVVQSYLWLKQSIYSLILVLVSLSSLTIIV